jgi:hypothetical protein
MRGGGGGGGGRVSSGLRRGGGGVVGGFDLCDELSAQGRLHEVRRRVHVQPHLAQKAAGTQKEGKQQQTNAYKLNKIQRERSRSCARGFVYYEKARNKIYVKREQKGTGSSKRNTISGHWASVAGEGRANLLEFRCVGVFRSVLLRHHSGYGILHLKKKEKVLRSANDV